MTPQGKAIKQAALDFGDGQTLPFTPCKKGYIPVVNGDRKAACPLHNLAREKRLKKEDGNFRKGEVDLNVFWAKYECKEEEGSSTNKAEQDSQITAEESDINAKHCAIKRHKMDI